MSEHLVTTEWLAENLSRPDLRIVDIRGHVIPASEPPPHYFNHHEDYVRSHIPGAVFVDWVYEITDPDSPLHARIAPPDRFAAVVSRIGVGADSTVVAYDDADGMFAARLWWSLHYYGHSRVAVLDGGWNKWVAENRPVTAAVPAIAPSRFTPRPDPSWIRSGDQVAAMKADMRLVDMRTPDEYHGRSSRARRKGRIVGAVNLPRAALIAPDGTLPPPDELRRRFAQVGVDDSTREAVFYCNAGVSASYGLLAFHVAGFQNGGVYDGSWKDWGNDDSRPIE